MSTTTIRVALADDPLEKKNLIRKKPAIRKAMAKDLKDFRRAIYKGKRPWLKDRKDTGKDNNNTPEVAPKTVEDIDPQVLEDLKALGYVE